MEVCEPNSKDEFESYFDLRWKILRKPWNQPKGSEKDGLDEESIHIMVCEEGRIIGVGRAHFNSPDEAQIRYMAVEEDKRKKGVGSLILKELEKRIKGKYIVLNARENAVEFYKNKGYRIIEKGHLLFGSIQHYKMRKDI
jgi:predicted GNAT family N-acyltransferase